MKRTIRDVLGDVTSVLNQAIAIESILSVIIIFVISFVAFSLINLFPLILSSTFAVLYLINVWVKNKEKYTIQMIESKFPHLKDKLTTCFDTVSKDNFVIRNLRNDVSRELNRVDASRFFDFRRITFKSFAIVILIVGMLFVSSTGFKIIDSQKMLGDLDLDIDMDSILRGKEAKHIGSDDFADEEYASGEGLNIKITKSVDFNDLSDAEERDFKREEFVSYDELNAIGAEEYNDPMSEEEKDIVKNYFDRITR